MLYAAIDYWNYRRRQGKYSAQSMKKLGYFLATEKNFKDYQGIPLGHIGFVSRSGSIASWLIMYAGNGVVSHVTMFYGDGVLHDTISTGVQRRDFSEYFDGISYIWVTGPLPGTDLAYAKAFMDSTLGASYNWLGVARLGFFTLFGSRPGAPWHLCFDLSLVSALFIGLSWAITGNLSALSIAVLAVYPVLFGFNKFRYRNWLRDAIAHRKSNAN